MARILMPTAQSAADLATALQAFLSHVAKLPATPIATAAESEQPSS